MTIAAPREGESALAPFHPLVREWFEGAFAEPTVAQRGGWPPIAAGSHSLILAPTGSGKTLAAFLWALNGIVAARVEGRASERLLYLSPLKALNYDVERNLRGPLAGIAAVAERHGLEPPSVSVAVRTGDTPQRERQRMLRTPPDILITTPESLYLLLTSRGVDMLAGIRSVIVDEIHAVAGTKRGAHLALSLERLQRAVEGDGGALQRIGLSATQRPLSEIARFLGGQDAEGAPRPVEIVDAGSAKELDIQVVVPVDDMRELGSAESPIGETADVAGAENRRRSIWPAMYPELLELVRAHRSTLVFVNNRRLAERLALRLNELAEEEVARAHHGSLAREQRTIIEEDLKAGRLPCLVATSSLELGIDMGAVDLVIQVESPRSVARGMQRIGRAGHQVGAPSRGRIFPKYRGDLLECAAVVERMGRGAIEETHVPRLPLDVLAQQLVAVCSDGAWTVDELHALARGAYPFADLSREQLEGVLDMLAGRYPSDDFAELRPRVVWDRTAGTVRGREGARALAVQNAGTIPDRGLYAVVLPDGARVGELDEEMVYEARSGQTFMLGASTWRIEEITRDRVIVTPAPGAPGALPFWKGEGVGRPYELGEAVGRLARELIAAGPERAAARLRDDSSFDGRAARNLVAYLEDQAQATGTVPSDRAVVVERFRDEIGDWRLCVLTPFGARVHAPWALAVGARIRARTGQEAHTIWGDDGIAVHLPDADEAPAPDIVTVPPDELEDLVLAELGGTALFGARFRENAARALLIPRRRPGQRTPLWQQRLKASSLLQVARNFGSFPVILETYRECLNDWFDLPALRGVLARIDSRELAVVEVETATASPFAGSLLFEYVASYMYEDDTPVAERRAQALSLNRDLLRELLGQEELRDLIDPGALETLEADLQGLSERARARGADGLHDLLRRIGDLSADEVRRRVAEPSRAGGLVDQLVAERRACRIHLGGEERVIAAEDAGRYRDGLGAMPPSGIPEAFLEPVPDALRGIVARFARSRGPFHGADLAARYRLPAGAVEPALADLEAEGVLVRGELRPGGSGREWCDAEVVRRLRRASLAALRREIEPAEPRALGRFLPDWQRVDRAGGAHGVEALRDALTTLQGLALPPAQWEGEVLPRRVPGYATAWLDELAARGEVVWVGAGAGGVGGGRVALLFRDDAPLLGPPPADPSPDDPTAVALRAALASGASFWDDLVRAVDASREDVFTALWALVWAGEVTNDLWLPLRAPRRLPALQRPSAAGRRRLGARRGAPSAVAGRWSLAGRLFDGAVPDDERRRATAELLVERHGILTRSAALAEGVPGGYAAVYPALSDLETLGVVRRGYFVAGLGGAQFAMPGAVERLRDLREAPVGDEPATLVIGAADPAQPYGAAAPWPKREGARSPARVFGAQVVLVDGAPALYLERGGRALLTFAGTDDRELDHAVRALAAWVLADRRRRLSIERVDGEPVFGGPMEARLAGAGFATDLRGLVLRA
ncbi:Lhr family helicase [Miltoncostaea marina]|uniref:Lhr family helicase n=1 Tax=Miltoncostaea marina TaxID=2843215 RepID=UPI001C3D8537|nr:DEAD/DEAH box helicase [Miltoncostaea marina]